MNDDTTTEEQKKLPEESNGVDPTPVDENNNSPEETTEIDIAPTTDIAMPEDEVAVDHEAHSHSSSQSDDSSIPETWIELVDGKFKCSECDNEVEPETNTIEGVVKADLAQIKADLTQFPSKVIYGICPVCGMEFVFRLKDDKLFLEPSDLEK